MALDDLKKAPGETGISSYLQAHVLLKFAGLEKEAHASIISSVGSMYDQEAYGKAREAA